MSALGSSTEHDLIVLSDHPGDLHAGFASATVNASQQIGASLGTSLLATIATSAATHYLTDAHHAPGQAVRAAVHGCTVGFSWAAAIFAIGALVSAMLFTRGVPRASRRRTRTYASAMRAQTIMLR